MSNKELFQELSTYMRRDDAEGVKRVLSTTPTHLIAEALRYVEPEERIKTLDYAEAETASEVLLDLEPELREEVLRQLDPDKIAAITGEMDSDDAADVIAELPESIAKSVLEKLSPEEVMDVETLLRYPEDTAGGIMQTELINVTADSTVRDVIDWIRLIADEVEDFYEIFVTDYDDKLLGVVTLKKLILANHTNVISEIMDPPEATVTPEEDQEKVADIFDKYDIVVLPVVDEKGVLIGRITADDVIDVITEEASEDMLQMAGVGEYTHPLYTPTIERLRSRIPWILMILAVELVIAFIIVRYFKTTLEKVAILAAFMPAIMATGGSVGNQTNTIVIRGLSVGTINIRQIFAVIMAEVKLALLIGIIAALVAAIAAAIISYPQPQVLRLSFAIAFAMTSAMLATSIIGVLMPMILYKLHFDPAVSSNPIISMSNDLFGIVIYLLIATILF